MVTERQARTAAPERPPCFSTRESWTQYLLHCQEFLKREESRPFIVIEEVAVFRPTFNFCRDCLPAQANEMLRAGRCRPSALRVESKEPACV